MTTQPIMESGMTFGPYPPGHCFYIEQSTLYKSIEQNIKMAEFLLLRPQTAHRPEMVLVIEAKKSSPRPETQPNFDDFIAEIQEKLSNALALGIADCLKRHQTAVAEIPMPFQNLNLATTIFQLVLVINGHHEAWLPPLQEALNQAFYVTRKIWALPATPVVVMNDMIAKEYGLIS